MHLNYEILLHDEAPLSVTIDTARHHSEAAASGFQNNAARVALQAPRRSHANSLLQELHWLPVEQRITYKLAVLTYKTRQTSVPKYLSRHIATRSSMPSLRSSSTPLLHVPFRRTSFGKRSFSTAAPSVWNSLPVSVRDCDTLTLFKSRLKAHLFSPVYAS